MTVNNRYLLDHSIASRMPGYLEGFPARSTNAMTGGEILQSIGMSTVRFIKPYRHNHVRNSQNVSVRHAYMW